MQAGQCPAFRLSVRVFGYQRQVVDGIAYSIATIVHQRAWPVRPALIDPFAVPRQVMPLVRFLTFS